MPSLIEAVERANSVILRAFQVFLGGNQHVLAENGNTPFTKITRKVIVAGRDRRSKRPASARHFLDAMKGLFASAVEAEHVTVNPTVGIQSQRKARATASPLGPLSTLPPLRSDGRSAPASVSRSTFSATLGCAAATP